MRTNLLTYSSFYAIFIFILSAGTHARLFLSPSQLSIVMLIYSLFKVVFNIDEQSGDSGLSFRTLYSVGKKGVKVTEMQFSLIL